MVPSDLLVPAIDAAAIAALIGGCYLPRHKRGDLAVALATVNVGVFAVTHVLSSDTVGTGVGLGLFGVLSIIRLRSTEISQRDVAYYFAALAVALCAGLSPTPLLACVLCTAVVAVIAVLDSSRVLPTTHPITLVVDEAIGDDSELARRAEMALGQPVSSVQITKLDQVNDLTHIVALVSDTGVARGSHARLRPAVSARA
ncbi:DUF4956 domain-containing protein [Corynebacterium aquilae]|uniref:DUF4956 domain-containing protein n=1 Tax=Corynebacterium aquilae DSM 44791 TaxID=1431546 RepID=A0A1L7CH64_9CORY|nr:DUF4956 domain-containing protein [Corynebacterium aquilae]APT85169.1 hypothetical protein CAQU_08900 [Corynebacterium aquilae DSM 44791]